MMGVVLMLAVLMLAERLAHYIVPTSCWPSTGRNSGGDASRRSSRSSHALGRIRIEKRSVLIVQERLRR